MLGKQGIDDTGNDGIFVPDDAREERLPGAELLNQIVADLFSHGSIGRGLFFLFPELSERRWLHVQGEKDITIPADR